MPFLVRVLIVVTVVSVAAPLVRFAIPRLHLFGISRPSKMTAEETAAALPSRLPWRPVDDPGRDVRCEENTRTSDARRRMGGWDYVCTFVPQPGVSPKRLKVGVLVGPDKIKRVSSPYELDARLMSPGLAY